MTSRLIFLSAFATSLSFVGAPALAFNSGSTGADGPFTPTVSTPMPIQMPASGVFNFTTINIPTGVTVTFSRNAANTPLVILASGDVTIAGTLSASGAASPAVGPAGNGNSADDGLPGLGGPGGYDGGPGGQLGSNRTGGNGLGPGGGPGGLYATNQPGCRNGIGMANGGAGAGFAVQGGNSGNPCGNQPVSIGGPAYGSSILLPLIGGSGGGGGAGGIGFVGSGGGGGGGALVLATSGTLSITGSVLSNGGASGAGGGDGAGGSGGGGSGGGIRLIATTLAGNGTISAIGGIGGAGVGDLPQSGGTYYSETGGTAAVGRIRLEADTMTRTAASTPPHQFGSPGLIFIAGQPTLTITSVAGVSAPANPTGVGDVQLPSNIVNPVTVTFTTTGVPAGNTISVRVTPATGSITTATSGATTGSTSSATASASVTLPQGASTLLATTTFTVVASLGDALSRYANNERVEKITLVATLGGKSEARLITVSGKEFPAPPAALLALGG